jgi:hypothetical protein
MQGWEAPSPSSRGSSTLTRETDTVPREAVELCCISTVCACVVLCKGGWLRSCGRVLVSRWGSSWPTVVVAVINFQHCSTHTLALNRWVKGFLARSTQCFHPPTNRQDGLEPAVLRLLRASVADPSGKAMPFPVFVAKGWLVDSITSFSPFDRLGLWVAYMEVRGTTLWFLVCSFRLPCPLVAVVGW